MSSNQRCWTRWLAMLALLAGLIIGSSGVASAAPAADIDGNTYTSPQFGFTITWDDSWFVVGEESDEFDTLNLTNGMTYGTFVAGNDFAGNARLAVITSGAVLRRDPSISEIKELQGLDGDTVSGGDDSRYFAAYSLVVTLEDGSTLDMAAYLESRTLVTGESVVLFNAFTPLEFFFDEWPAIQKLFDGVDVGSASSPDSNTPDTPNVPDPQVTPEVEAEPEAGEPGPAFVSGQWRVAVRIAALNDAIDGVGLDAKDGKEWLVVLADVTNWSSEDAEFSAREFTVQADGDDAAIKAAPSSTGSVAGALGVGPDEESLRLEIPAGETRRVVLVYSIPERSRGIVLQRDGAALPLSDALDISIDPEELPALVAPPEVQTGELVSASDGKTVRVQIEGKSKSSRIRLLGVQPPAKDDCFENEAEALLDRLPGQQVLIEEDGAVTGGSGTVRYLWLVNDDGTRTLINHQLIADGLATTESLPIDARFGAWFLESEQRAETESIGLWNGCAEESNSAPDAAPTKAAPKPPSEPKASPKASPTPDD